MDTEASDMDCLYKRMAISYAGEYSTMCRRLGISCRQVSAIYTLEWRRLAYFCTVERRQKDKKKTALECCHRRLTILDTMWQGVFMMPFTAAPANNRHFKLDILDSTCNNFELWPQAKVKTHKTNSQSILHSKALLHGQQVSHTHHRKGNTPGLSWARWDGHNRNRFIRRAWRNVWGYWHLNTSSWKCRLL